MKLVFEVNPEPKNSVDETVVDFSRRLLYIGTRNDAVPLSRTPPLDILHEMLSALETETHVILATVISTRGSTPASAFSRMLVKNSGRTWFGTVGGGCMEGDVLEAARMQLETQKAQILTFHLNEDDILQGLICGGSLDVLIEPVTRAHIPFIKEWIDLREDGEDGVVLTMLEHSGKESLKHLFTVSGGKEGLVDQWKCILGQPGYASVRSLPADIADETWKAYHCNETQRVQTENGQLLLEPVAGQPHLIIFGGGHVSKSISKAASLAGFKVTIVDDRKEYANPERFPEASHTLAVEFHDAFNHLTIKASTYIVIVTRGHRSDEEILGQAVKTPAKYIGMIGSKRKVLTTYEHLVDKGVSVEALKRIHAPMGIEIGAVTPDEIAVSIVAQLINVRRGAGLPLRHKSGVMQSLMENLRKK